MRDIAGEGVLIGAGGRSILLQIANPAIGHGVAHHSNFASRPLDRLRGTLTYVYAVVFGTPAEAASASLRVNRAHGPVVGKAVDGAPAYSAFTPELQLWVAATLYDSAITMRELVFGPLDDDTADALYLDYAVLGTALQVPAALWPVDRAAFAMYFRDRLAELRTDATTRAVAWELLYPRSGPVWLRLLMPVGRLLTVGLLPPLVRELFQLDWSPRSQRRFDRLLAFIGVLYPLLPLRLRHWPKNHFLRAVRQSMEEPAVV
ncbi:DUF2236 domain-containing protein [Cryobacterium fucosi]|uniref:DUF2236 domain-containing protein n=2 Tax=Cryobacterium fucosi TaxID=1259157 RepID=A0A4R9B3S0_9MICO|nr:oxygenase MpaB family protein [Cryobacterium fucosi]TFD74854.1 DUF2236 domain-containing protein [Cryobacterium fucosi]